MAGRPSTYTHEIEAEILERLASGESLRAICQSDHLPSDFTVRNWVIQDKPPEFAARYAHARGMGLDAIAEEIIEIADVCREGEKVERKEIGRACSLCGLDVRWLSGWKHSIERTVLCEGAAALPVVEEKTTTGDMIERARLQVDARKWLLSKMRPDKYGDRTVLAGDKDSPLEVHTAGVEMLTARIDSLIARQRKSGTTPESDG
jgi:hypothetical protein